MNKQDTIKIFEQAISNQNFIMSRIRNSINNNRKEEIGDIVGEENKFGEVLYNKNLKYQNLLGSVIYDRIDKFYIQWKEKCEDIFKIYIKDITVTKRFKYNKLIGRDLDRAIGRFDDLNNTHQEMINLFNIALSRLNALSEDKFL
ncbi:hypothetical protein CBLAS_0626 [Campylobacter blaseri]|uniref:Uncharacterized protein n=1 Tax=Campylobacter blaseri TaxID=2042961 RepID=A0A2P8R1Z8_9BACT|nr:hypothetical protein [Campylobacter blaseri]PSM52520.1 hypothetical protein CQ405_01990 [Campylobacter blaseri]PSM54168.1 hypothetical protein CRN67_01990 [Campylobacter blaseri]QKF85818.1 hypothetical protein CBLAS_0626 [Campylobacter blaseri]